MDFRGGVALVTGAANGLGFCAARQLAGQGTRVAALDVDESALLRLAHERPSVTAYPMDVTDGPGVASVVDEVEDRLGRIDLVINAAGVMPAGLLLEQSAEAIRRVMEVNFGGTVNVTLAALPRMIERSRGEIVTFASLSGWVPARHSGAYGASSAAVAIFTEVLAHENRGSGVAFVCVCSAEDRTPLHDPATPHAHVVETSPALTEPEALLAAAARALRRGRLFVFPGWRTAAMVRLRRYAPRFAWALDHRVEGT